VFIVFPFPKVSSPIFLPADHALPAHDHRELGPELAGLLVDIDQTDPMTPVHWFPPQVFLLEIAQATDRHSDTWGFLIEMQARKHLEVVGMAVHYTLAPVHDRLSRVVLVGVPAVQEADLRDMNGLVGLLRGRYVLISPFDEAELVSDITAPEVPSEFGRVLDKEQFQPPIVIALQEHYPRLLWHCLVELVQDFIGRTDFIICRRFGLVPTGIEKSDN
jgi:hypothetical protein